MASDLAVGFASTLLRECFKGVKTVRLSLRERVLKAH